MSIAWTDIETEPYCYYMQAETWLQLMRVMTNRYAAVTHRDETNGLDVLMGWAFYDQSQSANVTLGPWPTSLPEGAFFTKANLSTLIGDMFTFLTDLKENTYKFRNYYLPDAETKWEWKWFPYAVAPTLPDGYIDERYPTDPEEAIAQGIRPRPHDFKYFVEHFREVLASYEIIGLSYLPGGNVYPPDSDITFRSWRDTGSGTPALTGVFEETEGSDYHSSGDSGICIGSSYASNVNSGIKAYCKWDRPFPSFGEPPAAEFVSARLLGHDEHSIALVGDSGCDHIEGDVTLGVICTTYDPISEPPAPGPDGGMEGAAVLEFEANTASIPFQGSVTSDVFFPLSIGSGSFYNTGMGWECRWTQADCTRSFDWHVNEHWHNYGNEEYPDWKLIADWYARAGDTKDPSYVWGDRIMPYRCELEYRLPLHETPPSPPLTP